MKKDFLIIDIWHPGLGDHLWHSHLPRLAKEKGYKKFYITKRSIEKMTSRDTSLVWETNPYFDGFHEGEESLKQSVGDFLSLPYEGNIMDKIMQYYGLDDGERDHEPEFHYEPKNIPSLKGKVVYDPNYLSQAGNLTTQKVFDWMREQKVLPDYQLAFRNRQVALSPVEMFKPRDLLQFCDGIASAGDFICLNTGSAILADALQIKVTVLYGEGVDDRTFCKRHTYVKL